MTSGRFVFYYFALIIVLTIIGHFGDATFKGLSDLELVRWAVLVGCGCIIDALVEIKQRLPEPPPIPAKPRWAPFDRVDAEFIGAAIAGLIILGIVLWAMAVKG